MTIKIKVYSVIRCRRQPISWKHWITICTAVCVALLQSYRIQRPMCSSTISLLHKIACGCNLVAVREAQRLLHQRQHRHRYLLHLPRTHPPDTISMRTNRIDGHPAHRIPMNYVPIVEHLGQCAMIHFILMNRFQFFSLSIFPVLRSESDVLIPTAPKRLFSNEPISYRNLTSIHSNDSLKFTDSQTSSNNEWIRPHHDSSNWKGFPRPASRNVMHIDHGSSIVLRESMTSSSDDNKSTPLHPGRLAPSIFRKNIKSAAATMTSTPPMRPTTDGSSSDDFTAEPKCEPSPAIFTEVINTGSEFRYFRVFHLKSLTLSANFCFSLSRYQKISTVTSA